MRAGILIEAVSWFSILILVKSGTIGKSEKLENACRFSQFRCSIGALCLDTEKLCNGVEDCPEGEDERGNVQYDCSRTTLSDDCKPGEFRCRFGGCIPNSLRCNGHPDCWGGTDEAYDFCNITPSKYKRRPPPPPRPKPPTPNFQTEFPTTSTTPAFVAVAITNIPPGPPYPGPIQGGSQANNGGDLSAPVSPISAMEPTFTSTPTSSYLGPLFPIPYPISDLFPPSISTTENPGMSSSSGEATSTSRMDPALDYQSTTQQYFYTTTSEPLRPPTPPPTTTTTSTSTTRRTTTTTTTRRTTPRPTTTRTTTTTTPRTTTTRRTATTPRTTTTTTTTTRRPTTTTTTTTMAPWTPRTRATTTATPFFVVPIRKNPEQEDNAPCPIVELDPGQKVSCFLQKLAEEIDCEQVPSPDGTRAEITCSAFWLPPETGPHRTIMSCKNGRWRGKSSEFGCELDCGTGGTAPSPLVTGGHASEQGKWPWHAGLYESDPPGSDNYRHICGATLITRQVAMTAAHCVTFPSTNTGKNPQDLRAYLGKFFRTYDRNNERVQAVGIRQVIVHAKYDFAHLDNDIAILLLDEPANINAYVHPVCVPREDFDGPYVGDEGSLAGWGSLGNRQYPEMLHEAKLAVRSAHECTRNSPVLANLVRESTFCAGHKNGTSACDGDSGGGLVFKSDYTNKWVVAGVVSGGVPKAGGRGCDPKYYAAFTKVSTYRRWIDRILDRLSFETRRRRHLM